MLPAADHFVIAAPATGATRHLIGAAELCGDEPHAWIVNVARGSLIDTEALVEALRGGSIGGAGARRHRPRAAARRPSAVERAARADHAARREPGGDAARATWRERVQENVPRFANGERVAVDTIDPEARSSMLKEFREFILRGNVVDLAVAVVIGAAFGAVVTALVADIVTPLIAAIGGKPDFAGLTFTINGSMFRYGRLPQRGLLVPDHRGGDLLLRRQAAERADGAAQGRRGAGAGGAVPEDIVLLTEIRDLLQSGVDAVAADVAVRAADADVHGLGVRRTCCAAQRTVAGSTRARPPGPSACVVAVEVDLDLAVEHEVQLLLALVRVASGVIHDGGSTIALTPNAVTPSGAADLAEARARRRDRRCDATAQPAPFIGSFGIGRHTRSECPARRNPRGAPAAAEGRAEALGGAARRGRRARADRRSSPTTRTCPRRTRRPLIEVAKRYGIVACVSGRRASDARRIVSLGSIAYLGSHGSEVLRPGAIAPELDRELQAWTRRVQAFAHEAFGEKLRRLRVRLEDKEAIAALHWRGVPDEEDALAAIEEVAERGRAGRLRRPLGPQGARDPAAGADRQGRRASSAAARHATSPPPSTSATTSTDLDAFRGLTELRDDGAARLRACASACAPTRARRRSQEEADVMVEGTDGVRDLLRALLD